MESTYRSGIDLGGAWLFRADRNDEGVDEAWFDSDAAWTDAKTVSVPHAWQEEEPYRDYAGVGWYQLTVEGVSADSDERAFLRFEAADYETTVWVNGRKVGTDRGGYLPFEFEVTDALATGKKADYLAVRVSDPEDLSEVPHGKQGAPWYTRVSGIWQDVSLEVRPQTFIERVEVTPKLETDSARVEVVVNGPAGDLDTVVEARRNGSVRGTAELALDGGRGTAIIEFADPAYWTPETPALYDVTVTLERDGEPVDTYEDYFGMREFDTDGDRFYLNGEPVSIRGALDQGYYPETLYRPFEEGLFEREVRTAKKFGLNTLRKHIKPAHPRFLEAADRLGLLVWEEPANPTRYTERSKREVREQIAGMVERDYNRPSVVVVSLYNEEWGVGAHGDDELLWTDEEKQTYLAELYEETRERDPTRLVCDNSGWAHVRTDVNDYHPYFVSPDRADAWRDKLDRISAEPGENYASAPEMNPADAPVVVSEFGTWGISDVDALRERYDGDPRWFRHDFFDDPIKQPAGVDGRWASTDLPRVFDGYGDLAAVWQDRQRRSITDVVERMRVREDVAGWVVTEFSDVEWEFNGLLDYFREEKSFAGEFAGLAGPVSVVVEPSTRTCWAGEEVDVDLVVVNDTTEPFAATFEWEAFGRAGAVDVQSDGFGATRVPDAFSVEAPEGGTGRGEIRVETTVDGRTVRSREAVVGVDPRDVGVEDAAVYAGDATLSKGLTALGVETAETLDGADAALASDFDDVESFVANGGRAVVLPDEDGAFRGGEPFETRSLPKRDSWNLAASLFYHDGALLGDVTPDRTLGWEFEGAYPYELVSDLDESDDVLVGYVEGWLANWASPLVARARGDGTVIACTFRVGERLGDDPIGALLVSRLLTADTEPFTTTNSEDTP